jgi:hypothetical protein
MSAASKLLIFGGIALAAFGMLYGLHYALFVEHQTLDSMGGSLATAFTNAAERHMPEAHTAVAAYAATRYDYVRQVDVHSHWIGLAMLMIVLGVAIDHVALAHRIRFWIALTLLVGSVAFPLGVLLQSETHGAAFATATTMVGAVIVTVALAAVVVGFARQTG